MTATAAPDLSTTATPGGEEFYSDSEESSEDVPVTEGQLAMLQKTAFDGNWLVDVPMAKWNRQQMEAWAVSLQYNDTSTKIMRQPKQTSSVLGATSPQALAKLLKMSMADAHELFQALQAQKRIERQRKMNAKMGVPAQKIFSTQWRTKSIQKWSVKDTVGWIKSLRLGKREAEVMHAMEEQDFDGVDILNCDDARDLSGRLDVKPSVASSIYRAAEHRVESEMESETPGRGGTTKGSNSNSNSNRASAVDDDEFRSRQINIEAYPHIALSKQPDVLMEYTDADLVSRAEMPCGHAMAAETMYFYIKSVYGKHLKQTDIFCPLEECGRGWPWKLCLEVADMSKSERALWNGLKAQRESYDYCECPHCRKACHKKLAQGLKTQCACGKPAFCWACRGVWKKSSSLNICGNSSCSHIQQINSRLRNCGSFQPNDFSTAPVPLIRACPNCMIFLEHRKESDGKHRCSHVSCHACKPPLHFCYVCLVKYKGTVRQCDYRTHKVAPRQQFS